VWVLSLLVWVVLLSESVVHTATPFTIDYEYHTRYDVGTPHPFEVELLFQNCMLFFPFSY
jgi:hypothetical protein